jgi:hypothetical protein
MIGGATLLAIAVAAMSATSGTRFGQDAIDGVWRFQGNVDRRADGTVVTPGPPAGYDGILIFSRGYMSSTLFPKGRTWRREDMSAENLRDTFEGGSAHAGRYEIDPAAGTNRI